MNELIEKMLSSELLTEDSRVALVESIKNEIETAKNEAREKAIVEARAEAAEKYAEDRERLSEALETKFEARFEAEIQELKEDIERYKDLEADYALKLVEAKEKLGLELRADWTQLVEGLDLFIETALKKHFQEINESIEDARKNIYARKIMEGLEATFREKFYDESGLTKELNEQKALIKALNDRLVETESNAKKFHRESEMSRVMESLHGRPKEVMEAILKNIPTDKLDEAYNKYIGRVLHESVAKVENKSESDVSTSVLAEGDSTAKTPEATKLVTGDSTVVEHIEEPKVSVLSEATRARFKKLAVG